MSEGLGLSRNLLVPGVNVLGLLSVDILTALGKHQTPYHENLHVINPAGAALAVLSAHAIKQICQVARPESLAATLERAKLVDLLEEHLPPSAQEILNVDTVRNVADFKAEMDVYFFGAALGQTAISDERAHCRRHLRQLAGLRGGHLKPPAAQYLHVVALPAELHTDELQHDIQQIIEAHLPAGTTFILNRVQPRDTAQAEPYYLDLHARSQPHTAQ